MGQDGSRVTDELSPAEQRVVDEMRTAASEAEAAERLGLSPHTVHAYLRSARAKRNVRTTRALVAATATTHEQG